METLNSGISLSSFSSFIEVSIAINLLFSAWRELREKAVNYLSDVVEFHSKRLLMQKEEVIDTSYIFDLQKVSEDTKKIIRLATAVTSKVGIVIALCLIFLLAYIGINDTITLTTREVYFLCFFCVGVNGTIISLMIIVTLSAHIRIKLKANKSSKFFIDMKKYHQQFNYKKDA